MVEQVVTEPETEDVVDEAVAPPWMTILHNCECHTFEQVVKQLQKAIACSEAEGWEIAWQVHNTGKAVVKIGPEAECVRVGNILASIGLVVTVVQSWARKLVVISRVIAIPRYHDTSPGQDGCLNLDFGCRGSAGHPTKIQGDR